MKKLKQGFIGLTIAILLFTFSQVFSQTLDELELNKWNLSSMEYLLKLSKLPHEEFPWSFIGKYENGRVIILKDKKPFLKTNEGEYELINISENEYLIGDDERFGIGSSRLVLVKDGNELKINHKVFTSKIFSKEFKKVK